MSPVRGEDRLPAAAELGTLLDASPDAMLVCDVHGVIVHANGQTERLFGYGRTELVGQPIEILVPSRFAEAHALHREGYARAPRHRPMGAGLDLFARRRDGVEFPVDISLSALETPSGRLLVSAVRDVSDRKRLEEEIRRQSRLKSEFLASMSHELRTPLNSIIGFAELMHDGRVGPMAPQHVEYLDDILTSARHLLRLINDVLDLSKIESGRIEFFPEPIALGRLLQEVRDLVRTQAEASRVRIEIDVDPTIDEVVLDSAKLKQVLYNYVSNALKFTPEGGRVSVRARSEGRDEFRVEVEDTGTGIRGEDIDRLFVEFQQLDAAVARREQGTGLGLALTKRLVEAQGGRVGVDSTVGRGSRFFAILPRAMTAR